MDKAFNQDLESFENSGKAEITEPLLLLSNSRTGESESRYADRSIWMVLFSTIVVICGSFEFGSCMGYSAPAQTGIMDDLNISLSQYSAFGSILTIGGMVGAITSGPIADFIGRRETMRASAVICIAGWLIIYFSQDVLLLDIGRLSTGYGAGVLSYVVPIFIAEIAPMRLRGGLAILHQLLVCSGTAGAYIIGTFINWRKLALTGIIPCLLLFLGIFFIPESPRWLAKVGYQKEFEAALRRLHGKEADISHEAAEIQDYIRTLQHLPKSRMTDMFTRYASPLKIGVGLMALRQLGGVNGIGFYANEIFVSAGFSSGDVETIAMGCIQIPTTALGAILIDKTGRKPILLVSTIGQLLGFLLTAVSFSLKVHSLLIKWVPVLSLTGILVGIGSFSFGMGSVPWLIMSEIFPMNVKGAAGSLVTLVNWFSNWVIVYFFNFLLSWSSSGTFFLLSGICAATILFVAKMVPETKGQTLEEIQASMTT